MRARKNGFIPRRLGKYTCRHPPERPGPLLGGRHRGLDEGPARPRQPAPHTSRLGKRWRPRSRSQPSHRPSRDLPRTGSILYAHALNAFAAAVQWPAARYIVLQASNMLWVRPGMEARVRRLRHSLGRRDCAREPRRFPAPHRCLGLHPPVWRVARHGRRPLCAADNPRVHRQGAAPPLLPGAGRAWRLPDALPRGKLLPDRDRPRLCPPLAGLRRPRGVARRLPALVAAEGTDAVRHDASALVGARQR